MINGIVYIILGLIIAIVSKIHPVAANKFVVFFYVGLGMMAYGALWLLFHKKPRKKAEPTHHHYAHHMHTPVSQHSMYVQQQPVQRQYMTPQQYAHWYAQQQMHTQHAHHYHRKQ